MSPITIWIWVGIGVAAWFAIALALAILIGRMIRQRDGQVAGRPDPAVSVPSQRPAPSAESDDARVADNGSASGR